LAGAYSLVSVLLVDLPRHAAKCLYTVMEVNPVIVVGGAASGSHSCRRYPSVESIMYQFGMIAKFASAEQSRCMKGKALTGPSGRFNRPVGLDREQRADHPAPVPCSWNSPLRPNMSAGSSWDLA
jgi:hypothetical protein